MDRIRRWWCRVNDHELGEQTIGYDPGPNGFGVLVHSHVCHCGLYFIDSWDTISR